MLVACGGDDPAPADEPAETSETEDASDEEMEEEMEDEEMEEEMDEEMDDEAMDDEAMDGPVTLSMWYHGAGNETEREVHTANLLMISTPHKVTTSSKSKTSPKKVL